MCKRIVLTGLLTVLLSLVMLGAQSKAFVLSVNAHPAMIRVPDDYLTIKQAVAQAGPGDMIFVHEGLYAEADIDLYKPLTLVAEGQVIVDALYMSFRVFDVTSDCVVIRGFVVKNALYAGIAILRADNCRIEGNKVVGNDVGIWIEGGSNNIIKGNKVSNNTIGILLDGSRYRTDRNVVEKNVAEDNFFGMDFVRSNHNNVKHNRVTNNDRGIVFLLSIYNMVNQNKVGNNDKHGIALAASNYNLVKNNMVARNRCGIFLHDSRYNIIKRNIAFWNTQFGIALNQSEGNIVKRNVAFWNLESDLHWDGTGLNAWIRNVYKTKNW